MLYYNSMSTRYENALSYSIAKTISSLSNQVSHLEDQIDLRIKLDGTTPMIGDINMTNNNVSHRVTNLADPIATQDAATKAYVDRVQVTVYVDVDDASGGVLNNSSTVSVHGNWTSYNAATNVTNQVFVYYDSVLHQTVLSISNVAPTAMGSYIEYNFGMRDRGMYGFIYNLRRASDCGVVNVSTRFNNNTYNDMFDEIGTINTYKSNLSSMTCTQYFMWPSNYLNVPNNDDMPPMIIRFTVIGNNNDTTTFQLGILGSFELIIVRPIPPPPYP